MSEEAPPCPKISLSFGVFPDSPVFELLDETETSSPLAGPGLEDFILQHSPFDATDADGFDSVFEETVALVDSLGSALNLLAGAEGGNLDDTFEEVLQLDAEPVRQTLAGFVESLAPSTAATDALGDLLAGVPPKPGGGGGGGVERDSVQVRISFTGPGSPQVLCVTVDVT